MAKIINISGVIGWDVTPQDVREALQAANGGEVEVHISSPGGYISDGLEIFNLLRDYNGPINGVLKGYAMSMGSYIPLAIPLNRTNPGKLSAEDNAIYMIHNARGGVWGPHQDVLAYGEALKGMSVMIAKCYARRTGKTLDEVTAMMDAETFLFGDQIKEAGFVDEVIGTADDSDEQSARAQANAMFGAMVAKMSADPARMKADLQQVALMLGTAPINTVSTPAPAAAGIKKEEDSMTILALAALLAANPTAKAEHDAMVAQARTEGAAAVEARVTAAAPFLSNPAYGAAVGAVALKVVKGEEAQSTLTAVVAVLDAQKEQGAAAPAAAAAAAAPVAPAAPLDLGADASGIVKDDAGLTALVAGMKGGM